MIEDKSGACSSPSDLCSGNKVFSGNMDESEIFERETCEDDECGSFECESGQWDYISRIDQSIPNCPEGTVDIGRRTIYPCSDNCSDIPGYEGIIGRISSNSG
jgi:hypothetical protein